MRTRVSTRLKSKSNGPVVQTMTSGDPKTNEKPDGEPEMKDDDPDVIRDCYAVNEFSDACECEPEPLTKVRLNKEQRRE